MGGKFGKWELTQFAKSLLALATDIMEMFFAMKQIDSLSEQSLKHEVWKNIVDRKKELDS